MKQVIILVTTFSILTVQNAGAEIRQEYWFFPIGSWLIPSTIELKEDNIGTWAAPDESAYDMFDDFKLDWARAVLAKWGHGFWDNADAGFSNNREVDAMQAEELYLQSLESTGVRISLSGWTFGTRVSAFEMINYFYPSSNLPKMCYHVGIREGEGITSYPKLYGPDGVENEYFHPFKNDGSEGPGYPDYYDDEYPEFETNDYVPADATTNRDSFIHHTVTEYDDEHHNLTNPYDFYLNIETDNLYYNEAGHEVKQPHFSITKEGTKFAREKYAARGDELGLIYTPRFINFVVDDTGNETWIPYWARRILKDNDLLQPKEFEFANVPDDIDNYLRWYQSWVNDEVLHTRTTYPWRWNMKVNSKDIYVGHEYTDIPWFPYEDEIGTRWERRDYNSHGFPRVYKMLNSIREASRVYQIPAWCTAQVQQENGPGASRHPTSREIRSQVNMLRDERYHILSSVYYPTDSGPFN